MKVFYLPVFCVLIISFIACDGQDRMHMSPIEVLQENKLLDSFSEKAAYIPEKYAETITDSIFNNGFRVKVKNYSDMDNSILFKEKIDSIIYSNYFREFITHLIVKKNGKTIFDEIINKDFILSKSKLNTKFLNESVLFSSWVKDSFLNDKEVNVVLGYCNPTTEKCKYYYFTINEKGNCIINVKNEFD